MKKLSSEQIHFISNLEHEARHLSSNVLTDDLGLKDLVIFLNQVMQTGGEISDEDSDRLILLSQGLTRAYASFDAVPEADRLIELSKYVSDSIAV
jgi:hypothetical protein